MFAVLALRTLAPRNPVSAQPLATSLAVVLWGALAVAALSLWAATPAGQQLLALLPSVLSLRSSRHEGVRSRVRRNTRARAQTGRRPAPSRRWSGMTSIRRRPRPCPQMAIGEEGGAGGSGGSGAGMGVVTGAWGLGKVALSAYEYASKRERERHKRTLHRNLDCWTCSVRRSTREEKMERSHSSCSPTLTEARSSLE